ncbi:MAG: hypothetical protein GKR88_09490 [Flavobacteriaceae bacterium]|nr:MAG: hypothetical protein GKR88_09490 [Flavobacteriaceae bacterium]
MTQEFVAGMAISLESWDNSSLTNNNYYHYLSWSGGMGLILQRLIIFPKILDKTLLKPIQMKGKQDGAANNNAQGGKNCN